MIPPRRTAALRPWRPRALRPRGPVTAALPAPVDHRRLRRILSGTGEVAITLAVVILLYVVYQTEVTAWLAVGQQQEAGRRLASTWVGVPAAAKIRTEPGEAFGIIRVPGLGQDWEFTVLEGTDPEQLAHGVGHYVGTAMPGEPGNVGFAGHRVGRGAPFDQAHTLRSCDAVVLETQSSWYVYRVLPILDEEPAQYDPARRPECRAVPAEPGPEYAGLSGREIVSPHDTGVLAPIPHRPPPNPADGALVAHLLTITTCHPRFSARQRMVLHAVEVAVYPKDPAVPGFRPAELAEGRE